jgi:predicted ATP-binding protein involved in virulence
LKINEILASSIGLAFGGMLNEFANYLNSIYQYYGNTINELVSQNVHAVNYVNTKRMRNVNKQILRLYKTYINSCTTLNATEMNSIKESFIMPLAPFLELFSKSIP